MNQRLNSILMNEQGMCLFGFLRPIRNATCHLGTCSLTDNTTRCLSTSEDVFNVNVKTNNKASCCELNLVKGAYGYPVQVLRYFESLSSTSG